MPKARAYPEAGKVFGHLTIIGPAASIGHGRRVSCRCACGNVKEFTFTHLGNGKTISCGCYRASRYPDRTRHGYSKTRVHKAWSSMRERCTQPTHSDYANYGGRGIKVCNRWQVFENFLADMGEPPPGMTLDRINNNGDYEPENCRWASYIMQNNNTRWNVPIKLPDGHTVSLIEACRRTGVSLSTLSKHVRRHGKTHQQVFGELIRRLIDVARETSK